MSKHETPVKILNILKATPTKENEPDLPFKMPKNQNLYLDVITRIKED